MKPPTKFLRVLERIHSKTDQRYGQIISNALRNSYPDRVVFDTFGIEDNEFTKILAKYEKCLKEKGDRNEVFQMW